MLYTVAGQPANSWEHYFHMDDKFCMGVLIFKTKYIRSL